MDMRRISWRASGSSEEFKGPSEVESLVLALLSVALVLPDVDIGSPESMPDDPEPELLNDLHRNILVLL